MAWLIHLIDRINVAIGKAVSVLTLGMVVITALIVIARYLFSFTPAWLTELNWHFMTLIFLFGAAWALKENRHVRVDLFYERLGLHGKAWINLLGSVFFLVPVIGILIWSFTLSPEFASSFVGRAISTAETSSNSSGLPYIFPLKILIPLGLFFFLLQGIAELLRNLQQIINHQKASKS